MASRIQLAAAQMQARVSSSVLEKRIFMRSATFCTRAVTVSALMKGRRSATHWISVAACFSPRVRRMTTVAKMASRSTPRMAAKP